MKRLLGAFVPASLLTLILTGGFYAQLPWATTLWPWPVSPLSYVFIASILAAIAIPLLWIALASEPAAIRAGALDLTVMYGGMLAYVLTLLGDPGQPRLWPYAVVFALGCAGSAGAYLSTRRAAWIRRADHADARARLLRSVRRDPRGSRDRAPLPRRHLPVEARPRNVRDVRVRLPRRGGLLRVRRGRAAVEQRGGTAGRLLGVRRHPPRAVLRAFQRGPGRSAHQPDRLRGLPPLQRHARRVLPVRRAGDANRA